MQSIAGKTVIITGGTKGIGRVLALRIAKENAKVVIVGRNGAELENTKNELNKIQPDILAITGNVSIYDEVKRIVEETIRKFNEIHILVNNAGNMEHNYLSQFDINDWKRVVETNLFGTMMMCKECLPYMEKLSNTTGATIVNIASMSGKNGYERGTAYSASKFSLTGFSESLFKEVRQKNIRVVTVYPSYVETEVKDEKDLKEIGKGVYMRAEDVADTIIFSMKMPQRTLIKGIEIWATNP